MRVRVLPILGVAACLTATVERSDLGPGFDQPALARFHMRHDFETLGTIQRLLVAGRVDTARRRAALMTEIVVPDNAGTWREGALAVTAAEHGLASSSTLDDASAKFAQIGHACASCHLASHHVPILVANPPLPIDDATGATQMMRHRWATDRLWEGLVAPSNASWRSGIDVLATDPPPAMPYQVPAPPSPRLRELAIAARDAVDDSLADRAVMYGQILATCVGCHAARR